MPTANRKCLALALLLAAGRLPGQSVTLPVIRSSKTPEMTLLDHTLKDVRTIVKDSGLTRTGKDTAKLDTLNCALARIALSPYSSEAISSAEAYARKGSGRPTTAAVQAEARDTLVVAQAGTPTGSLLRLYGPRKRDTKDRADLVQGLRADPRAKRQVAHVSPDVEEIIRGAPATCELGASPSQQDIQNIVSYYADVEQNAETKAELDSLEQVALANAIQRDLRDRRLVPVRSYDEAIAFWRQPSTSALNIGTISGAHDQGTTFTELSSWFLHAVRFSLSTVISTSKDSSGTGATGATGAATTSKSAPGSVSRAAEATPTQAADTGTSSSTIDRFLNGGGLLNVAAAYPLVHTGDDNGAIDFIALFAPRVGFTVPALGVTARDTTLMFDSGAEFSLKSLDDLGGIGVFAQTRLAMAGGSPKFMTLIGDPSHRKTGYQTISFGLSLDSKYLVTLNRTVSGPHTLMTGWQIGVTMTRSPTLSSASP